MNVNQNIININQNSLDIYIDNFDISINNNIILKNAELKINHGLKYGLIGKNDIGKSTLLKAINSKLLKIPNNIDYLYLEQEIINEDILVIDFILKSSNYLNDDKIKPKAHEILYGLGFNNIIQNSSVNSLSGGWKMRLALAKMLFIAPSLLLLDEPTNHLDLFAIVWLEKYLIKLKKTIIIISHNIHFLNNICTNIIHIENQQLIYYKGNYNVFKKIYKQKLITKQKKYKLLLKSNKNNNNNKIINKPNKEYFINIGFNNVNLINNSILSFDNVSFKFSNDNYLFENLDFGLYLNSKIVIIGENGVGKSTLLKLIMGTLPISDGYINRNNLLKIGYLDQHLINYLPLNKTPIEYLIEKHNIKYQNARKLLGDIGIKAKSHTINIINLSGGEKTRVVLSSIMFSNPNLLILDEPTNNLDIETIKSLCTALNNYNGGIVIVSHDQYLINTLDCEVWLIKDKSIINYTDDI